MQLSLSDEQAARHFTALLIESLNTRRTQINGAIHILAKKL